MDMESSFLPLMSWMKIKMLMSQLGKGSLRIVYLIVSPLWLSIRNQCLFKFWKWYEMLWKCEGWFHRRHLMSMLTLCDGIWMI